MSFRFLIAATLAGALPLSAAAPFRPQQDPPLHVLGTEAVAEHIGRFNTLDHTHFGQAVSNDQALGWMVANVPLLDCPDPLLEEVYHFRWWTFRKHLKDTPEGFVVTEFLPEVSWSGRYNTISCPAGHHFREGRWIRERRYLDDYARFWFGGGGQPRRYSFWAADAILQYGRARGDLSLAVELLGELVANYEAWEASRLEPDGLFWQIDDRDGMEVSIGGRGHRGQGKRPTINSYMFGDAVAIAAIAEQGGDEELAARYRAKAERLRGLVLEKLWSEADAFFELLPRGEDAVLVGVRELHGYTPWYFGLPPGGAGYERAWSQLMDPQGFRAPYGPTTAEQRHPGFRIAYTGHECQWNGPSWPFATSVTLTALGNALRGAAQDVVSRRDWFAVLHSYARSHYLRRDDGRVVPWIDENLNPYTGGWIARTRLKSWKDGSWDPGKGGVERGKDYNHSTFCDLVVTGLAGLQPRADRQIEIDPLLPRGIWPYFCLDGIPYHGHSLTVLWDRDGSRYGRGQGLRVLVDGAEVTAAAELTRVTGELPE